MRPFVVATKLCVPNLRPRVVVRPALLDRLNAGLAEGSRLTLVSAPPGYGKTTLVAAWVTAIDRPCAWLSLDDGDDDPGTFMTGLVAACRAALPSLATHLDDAASQPISQAALVGPLCNELVRLATPLTVVLEDCQAVRSPAVHALVGYLLDHLPTAVHVVLVTRQDPPLPLARLRVRNQLTEVRAADLRFDVDETRRFLAETMALELGDEAAMRLTERTEGWIAGLQLAALSLAGHPSPEAFVAEFGATDRHLGDYLVEEALVRQPPDVQAFLRVTCVLDRLTGSLCDTLTGGNDGSARLVALERANLFLARLDERGEWYRWHALFAELVRAQLEPAEADELHRRAAGWFAAAGLASEAIRHALAAREPELGARLLDESTELVLARGDVSALAACARSLPADVVAHHPRIAVARAWTDFWAGGTALAETTLASMEPAVPLDTVAAGRACCLRAWIANRTNAPDRLALARRACDAVDPKDELFWMLARTNLGELLVTVDLPAAVGALEQARAVSERRGLAGVMLAPIPTLAYAYLSRGQRELSEALCRDAIAASEALAPGSPAVGVVHVPLGVALYEADELGLARQHLFLGRELGERAGVGAAAAGAVDWTEIRALHASGERELAWRRLRATAREAERRGLVRSALAMRTLEAELRLADGDLAGAANDLDSLPVTRADPPATFRELGAFTRIRVLLALGRTAEALASLDELERPERRDGCSGRLVTIHLLDALAHDRCGEQPKARDHVREAVRLGAPGGYRRAFLCEGPSLLALLPPAREVAPEFVDDVLARAASRRTGSMRVGSGVQPLETLVEPLSVRELEVLRLVSAGLSNGEIADALYVGTGTAKWHVHNILGKLGAGSRTALVARARALGLA